MEERIPFTPPAPQLSPPVKKSQEIQDEKSNFVNEYACRVLELLGMGHRLFVPRLLAVRDLLHRHSTPGREHGICMLFFFFSCMSFVICSLRFVCTFLFAESVGTNLVNRVLSNCCTPRSCVLYS